MIATTVASLCGGAISAATAGVFLLATDYPRTMWLVLRRSVAFYLYAAFYAVMGTIATALVLRTPVVDMVVAAGVPPNVLIPLIVGVSATLLKTSSVSWFGGSSLPPVARTLLLLVEPPLLRRIKCDEFYAVCAYLKKYEDRPLALAAVKWLIAANVPDTLPAMERNAFLKENDEIDSVHKALIQYLRFVGRKGFESVFENMMPRAEKAPITDVPRTAPLTPPAAAALKPETKLIPRERN